MSKIEDATRWMEQVANDDSHGYDQTYRWGERGDYDCSAAVITAWEQAGVPVKSNGASYTGNMYNAFIKCGFIDVTNSVNLSNGSGLVRGDVLLTSGKHTAMYCGNGREVEASINENGKATGGRAGDQTGREFLIRSYRNYPWKTVLRYPESQSTPAPTPQNNGYNVYNGVVQKYNQHVADLQWCLNKDFNAGLKVDGIYGQKTEAALLGVVLSIAKCKVNGKWKYINIVAWVQCRVGIPLGEIDGKYGNYTTDLVRMFQHNRGLEEDGAAGVVTIREIIIVFQ